MFALLYLLSALLVGFLAIGQRGGFPVFFVLALGLTPILALGMLILTAPGVLLRDRDRDHRACCDCERRRRY